MISTQFILIRIPTYHMLILGKNRMQLYVHSSCYYTWNGMKHHAFELNQCKMEISLPKNAMINLMNDPHYYQSKRTHILTCRVKSQKLSSLLSQINNDALTRSMHNRFPLDRQLLMFIFSTDVLSNNSDFPCKLTI
jgi:hypothetical protein